MAARVQLEGRLVTLVPVDLAHVDDLVAAATEDRTTYDYTRVPSDREAMLSYVEAALVDEREGLALPFTTCRAGSGRVIGSTRFLDLDDWSLPTFWPPGRPSAGTDGTPSVAEIGSTWLAASAQRSGVNTEAKLLMLRHAFNTWETARVTFKTDARNVRSRVAIERLGARFEGIRRAHLLATDGTIRDSAYYSIVQAEWPEVRAGLERRLNP